MGFQKTTLANDTTIQLVSNLLKEKYYSIDSNKEWWRHQEQEEVLKACNDLGLEKLREELINS